MAGVLLGSIGSGQIITATGRYKVFPIAGTALAAVGMLLLSRLDAGTSTLYASVAMFVMGLGLGLVMQVLVLAVQNAVDYAELGVATSGATLFRSMGGSLGTAVLGAIFTNRLADELAGSPAAQVGSGSIDPSALQRLPAALRDTYTGAFTDALRPCSSSPPGSSSSPSCCRGSSRSGRCARPSRRPGVGEAFASPTERRLAAASSCASSPASSAASARARSSSGRSTPPGMDLPPGAAWLLVQGREGAALGDPEAIAAEPPDRRRPGARAARHARRARAGGGAALDRRGHATAQRLLDARRDCLRSLVADWSRTRTRASTTRSRASPGSSRTDTPEVAART